MQLSVHALTRKCMEYKERALRARGSAQDAYQARSRVKGRQASSPGLGCQQVSQPLHTTSLSLTSTSNMNPSCSTDHFERARCGVWRKGSRGWRQVRTSLNSFRSLRSMDTVLSPCSACKGNGVGTV